MNKNKDYPKKCCGITLKSIKDELFHRYLWHNPNNSSVEQIAKEMMPNPRTPLQY